MTTYTLIHGGNYDSSCWQYLVPHLDGPTVLVDLPGRARRPANLADVTVDDFVDAAVADMVDAGATDTVLVAHSAGGLTAAHVVNRIPDRVRSVVLVSSTIPPHGSAIIDHIDPEIRESVLAGSGDGSYMLDVETAREALCNDLDDEMTEFALKAMRPDTTNFLAEPIDLTGLQALGRVTYVRTLRDQTLPLEQQDAAIAAVGDVEVMDLDAGHMSMLSVPEQLARTIMAAG